MSYRRRIWVASALLVVASNSCSLPPDEVDSPSSSDSGGAAPNSPQGLSNYLRASVSYDFDPFASPEALRSAVEFAGVGQIEGVSEALIDEPSGGATGAVVITLRLTEIWKENDTAARSESVHFVLRRPTNQSVDVYSKSLPVGTGVALFGYVSAHKLTRGAPDGILYEPAPQGLIIDDDTRTINVWGQEVNDDLPLWNGATSISGIRDSLALDR